MKLSLKLKIYTSRVPRKLHNYNNLVAKKKNGHYNRVSIKKQCISLDCYLQRRSFAKTRLQFAIIKIRTQFGLITFLNYGQFQICIFYCNVIRMYQFCCNTRIKHILIVIIRLITHDYFIIYIYI